LAASRFESNEEQQTKCENEYCAHNNIYCCALPEIHMDAVGMCQEYTPNKLLLEATEDQELKNTEHLLGALDAMKNASPFTNGNPKNKEAVKADYTILLARNLRLRCKRFVDHFARNPYFAITDVVSTIAIALERIEEDTPSIVVTGAVFEDGSLTDMIEAIRSKPLPFQPHIIVMTTMSPMVVRENLDGADAVFYDRRHDFDYGIIQMERYLHRILGILSEKSTKDNLSADEALSEAVSSLIS